MSIPGVVVSWDVVSPVVLMAVVVTVKQKDLQDENYIVIFLKDKKT